MWKITLFIALATIIPTTVLSDCSIFNANSGWTSNFQNLIYTSADSIVNAQIEDVCPTINPAMVPGLDASLYLAAAGPLGYLGPIGPQGPLGILGPIGSNTWNPSAWMFAAGDWSTWSQQMAGMGGVLSSSGPLGCTGPVSPDQFYGLQNPGMSLFDSNDFAVQLRGFGLWSALGPIGPLGALGPLGPLGPVGAHGYPADSNGNYVSNGNVIRTVNVPQGDGSVHTFELYENYQEAFAQKMTNQDTSFMVQGTSNELLEIDLYPMTSASNQIVTIVLVPVYDLTDYSLGLYDQSGKLIASSETMGFVQTLQLTAPAGTSMTVAVKLAASTLIGMSAEYRLFVTGSTSYLDQYNIQGPQVQQWYNNPYSSGDFDSQLSQ